MFGINGLIRRGDRPVARAWVAWGLVSHGRKIPFDPSVEIGSGGGGRLRAGDPPVAPTKWLFLIYPHPLLDLVGGVGDDPIALL